MNLESFSKHLIKHFLITTRKGLALPPMRKLGFIADFFFMSMVLVIQNKGGCNHYIYGSQIVSQTFCNNKYFYLILAVIEYVQQ